MANVSPGGDISTHFNKSTPSLSWGLEGVDTKISTFLVIHIFEEPIFDYLYMYVPVCLFMFLNSEMYC